MDTANRIRVLCAIKKTRYNDLAKEIGMSKATFSYRMRVGRFTISEQRKIAKALNIKYVSHFVLDDGTIINGENFSEMFRKILTLKRVTLEKLGRELGITRQAVCNKIKNGKFTEEEMKLYTSKIGGCRYEDYYEIDELKI